MCSSWRRLRTRWSVDRNCCIWISLVWRVNVSEGIVWIKCWWWMRCMVCWGICCEGWSIFWRRAVGGWRSATGETRSWIRGCWWKLWRFVRWLMRWMGMWRSCESCWGSIVCEWLCVRRRFARRWTRRRWLGSR